MYTIVDITRPDHPKLLEEIELARALFETYEGAVVMTRDFVHIVDVYLIHYPIVHTPGDNFHCQSRAITD